jgi:hypothetical protein
MVIVALLLFFPIQILAAGDHETRSCGNALSMDVTAWRTTVGNDDYFDQAFRACNGIRVDRLAKTTAVISVTIVVLTFMSVRRRSGAE